MGAEAERFKERKSVAARCVGARARSTNAVGGWLKGQECGPKRVGLQVHAWATLCRQVGCVQVRSVACRLAAICNHPHLPPLLLQLHDRPRRATAPLRSSCVVLHTLFLRLDDLKPPAAAPEISNHRCPPLVLHSLGSVSLAHRNRPRGFRHGAHPFLAPSTSWSTSPAAIPDAPSPTGVLEKQYLDSWAGQPFQTFSLRIGNTT